MPLPIYDSANLQVANLAPPQVDTWNPPLSFVGWSMATTADTLITGLNESIVGRGTRWLVNGSSFNITLAHNHAGSPNSADRFSNPADLDFVIPPGGAVELNYGVGWFLNKVVMPGQPPASPGSPNPRFFAADTTVAPASPGSPTIAEISSFVTTNTITDSTLYYTGSDLSTDTPTFVYHVDSVGVVTLLAKSNSGETKINDHAGTWGAVTHTANVEQQITVSFPLTMSSVTDWPATVAPGSDADLYDTTTDKWLENPVNLQSHIWRIIVAYSRASTAQTEAISYKIRNPLTGFEIAESGLAMKGVATGKVGIVLLTIADSGSIGIGYQMWFETTQTMDLTIDSITRISLHRDNE